MKDEEKERPQIITETTTKIPLRSSAKQIEVELERAYTIPEDVINTQAENILKAYSKGGDN